MSKCPHDPTKEPYCFLGMYHCPEENCGNILVGRYPHPDYNAMNDPNWEGWKELEESNRRQSEGIEKSYIEGTEYDDIGF